MAYRKYDTCFFERYAMLQLQQILGHKFDDLVNCDRPDLQTPGTHTLGIEVTRAMEGGRQAALKMLKDISGISAVEGESQSDIEIMQRSGYGYGLHSGSFTGGIELDYWMGARPMKEIIANKVSKVSSGFYGDFREFGLFVFSNEPLSVFNAYSAVQYTIELQRTLDVKYARLYISAVTDFYACNLEDGISNEFRVSPYLVDESQRRSFFLSSLDYRCADH
ncbi:MAG: hypothetical protein ACI3ZO_10230 [Candidatus Cryptobacteroides sp.]|nr:hypothetical protein [Bacteroidales bacterium]